MLDGLARDFAHAFRALTKARAYSLVCVISLGIGMGPVMAVLYGTRIFSVAPPGIKTDGLVEIISPPQGPRAASDVWSYPDYLDLSHGDTGVTMTGWSRGTSDVTISPGAPGLSVPTMFVSENYFETLGATLVRGPGFKGRAADPVVIVGENFWRHRRDADPDIVGKTLTIDGAPYDVVGIAPEGFGSPFTFETAELFLPLERDPHLRDGGAARLDRSKAWVEIHGRLAPGVTVARARAAVGAITTALARRYPATNQDTAGEVDPYFPFGNRQRGDVTRLEVAALTLTGFVLLVVCANLGGMMQVRSAMREREMSIRQSIGATRRALIRYLLAESTLLAAVGAALASIVLFNIPPLVFWLTGQAPPAPVREALRVDMFVVAKCAGLCLAASLLFGLLPALKFSRPAMLAILKDEAGGGGYRVGRVHRVTAALQVMIAVPLLVMGGISLDRVRATATSDLGFAADDLYAAPLKLDAWKSQPEQIRSAVTAVAGAGTVASVTVADGLPLDFRGRTRPVALVGDPSLAPIFIPAQVTRVGAGYLETMAIPIVRGRGFTDQDVAGAALVTVISKPLAEALLPNADPTAAIGRRLIYGTDEKTRTILTVVGVTGDFPTSQMSTARPQLLLPFAQHADLRADSAPISSDIDITPHLYLVARGVAGATPDSVITPLESVARERDPAFTRAGIVTGAWLRRNSMNDFLVQSAVAGVAGSVMLLLSALGIYGVVGLMVATRRREIAVRVALGATRRGVVGMVLLDVVKLVTPGIALGLILTLALVRVNGENMGVPLSGVEHVSYLAGAAIALLVAIAASLLPARRAAAVSPMVTLRST